MIETTMLNSPQILESNRDEFEETYDYTLSLFSVEDKIILNKDLEPLIRIEWLNTTAKNISRVNAKTNSQNIERIIAAIKRGYLLKIADGLLMPTFEASIDNATKLVHDKINYFDSCYFYQSYNKNLTHSTLDKFASEVTKDENVIFELFKNEEEFNLTFAETKEETGEKRTIIISKIFQKDYKKYLDTFKNKLISISKDLFKNLLFVKLQELEYEEIVDLFSYLLSKPCDTSYTKEDNNNYTNAILLHKDNYWGSLILNDQNQFYNTLRFLNTKLKSQNYSLTSINDYDKNIISFFYWLKSFPTDRIKTIEKLIELSERKNIFAEDKPNQLFIHLARLKEKISALCKTEIQSDFQSPQSSTDNKSEELCKKIEEQVKDLCKKALSNETRVIKNQLFLKKIDILKQLIKKLGVIFTIIIISLSLKYFHYNCFDISGIYLNNYIKNAKLSMESTPYYVELKDSLDPIKNETNQKQRLDYIRDLNFRYFKVIDILLHPETPEKLIKDSVNSLTIPKEIKNILIIKSIRSELSNIFSQDLWKKEIEPMLGPNVLSELRAYGAICNFLIPSLPHYVLKDINGKTKIYTPKDEKETLSHDLTIRLNKIPDKEDIEPKNYIAKYDLNYRDVIATCNLLQKEINKKKIEILKKYKTTSSKQEQLRLKNILLGIAILEVRLNDLKEKIQFRYNFIVKHNTYRAITD